MSSNTLTIKMFGEFSIHNEHHQFISTTSKSLQVTNLIAYLIANQDTEISKNRLIEILWPEDDCKNPSGALRNLIYRARQELGLFFPDTSIDCIPLVKNAYFWSKDIPCTIDIYEFEKYINLARKESNPDKRFEYNQTAARFYTGDFLPAQNTEEWVMFRSTYYRRAYTKCILNMCAYLMAHEQYEEVISLCENATAIDSELTDERLYRNQLKAYIKLHAIQSALDCYHSTIDLFFQKFGVDISDSMKDIYQEIIKMLPKDQLNIHTLEADLRQSDNDEGSFYCNFDIFKNIYQVNLRYARRTPSKRYLLLFSLTDQEQDTNVTNAVLNEMSCLYDVISKYLRRNDVFTKSSFSQYSVILTVANENGCQIAINRIKEHYQQRCQNANVTLKVDIKLIT